MSHILPEAQSVIDQLEHDFVKSYTPAMEQFQLDQNVQQAEAAVKLKYCMMHGLSPDEVTVSSSEGEHGVRTFTITEIPSTQMVDITFSVPLDEKGFPVGILDKIADHEFQCGHDPHEPQIIVKKNERK